jgi:Protein of unknown function (DUF1706)
MSSHAMTKEQLLAEVAAAYERLIAAATEAAQHPAPTGEDAWGPRQVVAHLAGWEVMANVRIPAIVDGMSPAEFDDPWQEQVMNDAINAAFAALAVSQPVETLCDVLRRAYQRTAEMLAPLNDRFFQPGEYVYERTQGVIEHCQEHIDAHLYRTLSG